MLDWLQLLNPAAPRHLLAPGAAGAAPAPSAQWLAPVLAAARLSSPPSSCGLTLLAPSDDALAEAGVAPAELAPADLQRWLLRHLTLDDVAAGGSVQMLDGQLLLREGAPRQWRDSDGRWVRPLGRVTARAGIAVQLVDRALVPVTGSLWARIAAEPGLAGFAAALQHTGLDGLLDCSGPFTVLAPSNRGLARAAARLGLGPAALWADRDRLATLLLHHLLPGRWSGSALPWGGALRTLAGERLHFSALGLLRSGDLLLPLAEGSDRSGSNGVLHRLDEALLPPVD